MLNRLVEFGKALVLGQFFVLLAHELGHAVVAVLLGYRVVKVEAGFLFVAVRYDREVLRPLHSLLISAAGPLAAMVFGTALWYYGLRFWAVLALFDGAVNLLPVLSDGAKIARAIRAMRMGATSVKEV